MLVRGGETSVKIKAVMDITRASQSISLSPGPLVRNLPFYLQAIGSFYARQNYLTERDGYASYLLLYTLSGCGLIEARQQQCLLPVNHVILIDCRKPHRYATLQSDPVGVANFGYTAKHQSIKNTGDRAGMAQTWNFCYVHLDGTGVGAYETILNGYSLRALHLTDEGRNNMLDHLTVLFEQCTEAASNKLDTAVSQSVLLQQMLGDLLLQHDKSTDAPGKSHNDQIVNHCLDWLSEHYANPVSLELLARQVNLSKYYFSRIFRSQTGQSPYNWLLRYRLNQSKQLLRNSNLSIQQIGRSCGFKDVNHFIRTFKKYTDETPLRYRKDNWLL